MFPATHFPFHPLAARVMLWPFTSTWAGWSLKFCATQLPVGKQAQADAVWSAKGNLEWPQQRGAQGIQFVLGKPQQ